MSENERTCYVGNLPIDLTEELLEEMFVQVGPLEKVILRNNNDSNRYGLVVFQDEESVPFAIETLDGVRLFDVAITVKPRNGSQQEVAYKKKLDRNREDPHKRRSCPDIPSLNQIDMGRFNPMMFAGLPPPPQPPYGTPPMARRDDRSRDTWHTPPPYKNYPDARYSGGSGSQGRRSDPRQTFPVKNDRSNDRGRDREYFRADYSDYDRRDPRDNRDRSRTQNQRKSYDGRRY